MRGNIFSTGYPNYFRKQCVLFNGCLGMAWGRIYIRYGRIRIRPEFKNLNPNSMIIFILFIIYVSDPNLIQLTKII